MGQVHSISSLNIPKYPSLTEQSQQLTFTSGKVGFHPTLIAVWVSGSIESILGSGGSGGSGLVILETRHE